MTTEWNRARSTCIMTFLSFTAGSPDIETGAAGELKLSKLFKCVLKKDWVHLSCQGAKPSGQKKQELKPSGNFSFGVKTAWTVVCCWEFLAQQTVWSLEGVSRRQQRGREESMSHLGLQTGEGSCQVSGCPWGVCILQVSHSWSRRCLVQARALASASMLVFPRLTTGTAQESSTPCQLLGSKLLYWSLLKPLGLLKLLPCP